MSLGPPGVKPTTKRTGFSGQVWAGALAALATPMPQINAERTRLIGLLLAGIILTQDVRRNRIA